MQTKKLAYFNYLAAFFYLNSCNFCGINCQCEIYSISWRSKTCPELKVKLFSPTGLHSRINSDECKRNALMHMFMYH